MLGSPAGPGGPSQRGLWPLAPAPAPSTTSFTGDPLGKYGVYSLFQGSAGFGSALYSHGNTIGRFASGHIQQSGNSFHATHKDSLFSTAGYTFGVPTPPPGSPYSPIPVTQLELLAKSFSNSNIIIQSEYPSSPKKVVQIQEKRCDEKCCSGLKKPCEEIKNGKYTEGGCSRTNPIEWNGVNVKKEPGTPCQVAEITTSVSPVVKLEVGSPTQKSEGQQQSLAGSTFIAPTGCNVPQDLSMRRERSPQRAFSSSIPPPAMQRTISSCQYNAQIKETNRVTDVDSTSMVTSMAASSAGGGALGGHVGSTILQCTDDRTAGLAAWQMGGAHSSALATPTVWQYPAPVPMESIPLPVPMPPVGFQLVRDPNSGGFLLLPTTGIEPLQQTVVWPSYAQPSPLLVPSLPPPPLQLLSSSSSDYLTSSTTLHQHTQTHSTRLVAVTTDSKRKLPLPIPTTTLIKIEDATLDQSKSMQSVSTIQSNTGTVFAEQPLVTTHVIYQPTNLILSQTPTSNAEAVCRSQATSPVTCLTPPPETVQIQEEETLVQDASNQTDTPICSEDDTSEPEPKEKNKTEPDPEPETQPEPEPESVPETEPTKPDISGLELLSNSIVEFENGRIEEKQEEEPKDDNLAGLDLLCALAEQRILEEAVETKKEKGKDRERRKERREKRKSKKHSEEPKRKKMKGDRHHDKKKKLEKLERDKNSNLKCGCQDLHAYKSIESEEEAKKFLASKMQGHCCKGDWPCMNAMELDMRMKLADLQRQYREKQKELSKLKPKKQDKKKKKRNHERSLTPPPKLEKVEINIKPKNVPELLKPPTLCPFGTVESSEAEAVDIDSSPEKSSSKRKVGRPKKLFSDDFPVTTETIVAKKPKSNFVGYLLAAKEKLQMQRCYESPPRYLEEVFPKVKKNKNNNDVIVDEVKLSKIRPKLKAEATVKDYEDEDLIEDDLDKDEGIEHDQEDEIVEEVKPEDFRCKLTAEHLEADKLRVLTAMDGLFYAGCLSPVEPPDVYSITLDGERGNRPHIMCREDILRDAIVEVSPKSTGDLPVGTRLCAYWSQQYRCLYPGSVAEPESPNPQLDDKFVCVEFDDGDSGRIALEDIRFLPPDYPIVEYDPNPLLSLSKRRRRISSSVSVEDRRTEPKLEIPKEELEKENREINKDLNKVPENDEYKENKKRLKKKKREKLKQKLLHEERKKKKKHRCSEENCKHRKHHKKHRKHKKHHDRNKVEQIQGVKLFSEENVEVRKDVVEVYEVANPDDEVTMDDVLQAESKKTKKIRDRQESCESRSKMSAFLPARQLWSWSGKGYKRQRAKGRSKKSFYKTIQRGKETITVGDSAVFLSTGRPDRPYIGRIEAMWELCGTMVVKVKWFYHPEETVGCPLNLQYPGALFESPHVDENDVQTISHKCEVLPLSEYRNRLGDNPSSYASIYENNDIYYLAGYYDPTNTTLKMEPGIPFTKGD